MKLLIAVCVLCVACWYVGTATAAVIEGTPGSDVLNGTSSGDKIYGYQGDDTINGKYGADLLVGGDGADTLDAGRGYDSPEGKRGEDLIFVDAADGKPDVVDCGSEEDIVFWRVPGTVIFDNCEHAYRITTSGDAARLQSWLDRTETP